MKRFIRENWQESEANLNGLRQGTFQALRDITMLGWDRQNVKMTINMAIGIGRDLRSRSQQESRSVECGVCRGKGHHMASTANIWKVRPK